MDVPVICVVLCCAMLCIVCCTMLHSVVCVNLVGLCPTVDLHLRLPGARERLQRRCCHLQRPLLQARIRPS